MLKPGGRYFSSMIFNTCIYVKIRYITTFYFQILLSNKIVVHVMTIVS